MPRTYTRKENKERPYNSSKPEDLEKAAKSGLPLRKAAEKFHVSKSTLYDYMKKKASNKEKAKKILEDNAIYQRKTRRI